MFFRHHPMGGWWWAGNLISLLFWVLLIAVIVWAVLRFTGGAGRRPPGLGFPTRPPAPSPDAARTILAERYARGEIDTAEYHERMQNLTGPPPRDTGAGPAADG